MTTIDFIAFGTVVAAALCGMAVGFGKGLNIFAKGVLGRVVSVIVCYFLFSLVLNIPFVQSLLTKFTDYLAAQDNFLCNLLLKIRIDLIVYAIGLFVLVEIAKAIVFKIVGGVFEIKSTPVIVVNKSLGVIFFLILIAILWLVVTQILAWTTGVDGSVYQFMQGSAFKLDVLFANNPLNVFFEKILGTV